MRHTVKKAAALVALCTATLCAGAVTGLQTPAYAATASNTPFYYRVDAGDQLAYLAKVYHTTVASIMTASKLRSTQLHAGQILTMWPGNAQSTHPPFYGQAAQTQPLLSMTATAYDGSAACNGPWGAVDYFGNPLQFGDVAVDPSVIPLGTRLFITGYDDPALPKGGFYATADDIGGAIVGDRIDIFLPSDTQALNFGIEHIEVHIVR